MAGNYYYSTPIGQGMGNLAQAIASLPERDAKAGLLAARQRLLDEQVTTEAVRREHERASGRYQAARAAHQELETRGQQSLGDAYLDALPYGSSGATGGSAVETQTAPDYGLTPTAPPTGVAGSVTGPISVAGGMRVPGFTPGPGYGQGVPGGGTGVTPDLARKVAGYGAWAGQKPEKGLLMYGGANLAAGATDPDTAISHLGQGAGEPFTSTPRGGLATIKQRADEAVLQSGDRRYNTDVDATTSRDVARIHESGKDRRGEGKGKGKGSAKPLSVAALKYTEERVLEEFSRQGVKATPAQLQAVVARISQRVLDGDELVTAMVEEMDNSVETTPEHEVPGMLWGTNTVPAKSKYKEPDLGPANNADRKADKGKAPAAAPAAKASAPAAAAPKSLPAGAKQIGTSGGKPVYQLPNGKKIVQD